MTNASYVPQIIGNTVLGAGAGFLLGYSVSNSLLSNSGNDEQFIKRRSAFVGLVGALLCGTFLLGVSLVFYNQNITVPPYVNNLQHVGNELIYHAGKISPKAYELADQVQVAYEQAIDVTVEFTQLTEKAHDATDQFAQLRDNLAQKLYL